MLVHMPPEGNYVSEGSARSIQNAKRRMFKNCQFGEALLPFGIGDGGGGPFYDMIALADITKPGDSLWRSVPRAARPRGRPHPGRDTSGWSAGAIWPR